MQHPPSEPEFAGTARYFAKPLTPENFTNYGDVSRPNLGESKLIRNGEVRLSKSAAAFSHLPEAPAAALDFYEVQPTTNTLHAISVERHPRSTQMFCPMEAGRWLVVIWPNGPDGPPEAFVAAPDDVVTYKPGIWHHGIVALDRPAKFASIMWKSETGLGDTEFAPLNSPVDIEWSQP
ncbi:ureidoglycolate lyase [Thalassovita gelatinovora]|uniref:ureidoglycolate lyase n=1 Tax=Thalassovita gelatinovora TaxID=53501 RepID=UPI00130E8708|nr:ureidoglycolate lyase [Thalassovita gelatinovora]QIZ79155.1 hypothetical protein HFZ77_01045 [Thalassovita gelatinovora]